MSDNGVSGISTRLVERLEGKRLLDMLRRGDVLVVRWVDRLGRNYADVVDTIREFMRRGVVVKAVINNMTFDGATKDPMQQAVRDALMNLTLADLLRNHRQQAKLTAGADRDFHLAAAKLLRGLVQAKAEHRERIMEGLERARAKGTPPGRPRVDPELEAAIKKLLKKGTGTKAIARETGVSIR